MIQKIKKLVKRFWVVPLFVFSLLSFAFVVDDDFFEMSKQLDIFSTLFKELDIYYVDETNPEKLTRKAIDAMLESLDPYTEFYPESELENYKMQYISTEYAGVGALVQNRDGKIIVSEPYEGFPAQKADIRAGDVIISVDGKLVKDNPVSKVSEMLKGATGTKLKVVIERQGEPKPLEKIITREEIKFGNLLYSGVLRDNIGYIKLDKFLTNAAQEFKLAFQELKRKNVSSLIIDLRGNGGGILQEAVQIVNLYVPKGGDIVTQKGKIKEMNMSYKALNNPVDLNIPICVLIDTATASASEITAGALQDLDRGVVVGQRSYGKGLVQQTKQLSYNAQVKITVAKYYTPSGRCVQAINYSKKNKKGKSDYVPDSLITEFKTKNNRLVYDGSGIAPDVKTDLPSYSNIVMNLVGKSVIFDYATQYRINHSKISEASKFTLTEEEYNDFVKYVERQDFDYSTDTEAKLKEIKKAAEEEKYFDQVKDEYEVLLKKISHDKTKDLVRFKPEIKEFLENEIVSRYYFQKGRIEHFNRYDKDIEQAVKILDDKKLYQAILNGEGTYKVIGKPSSKADGERASK